MYENYRGCPFCEYFKIEAGVDKIDEYYIPVVSFICEYDNVFKLMKRCENFKEKSGYV